MLDPLVQATLLFMLLTALLPLLCVLAYRQGRRKGTEETNGRWVETALFETSTVVDGGTYTARRMRNDEIEPEWIVDLGLDNRRDRDADAALVQAPTPAGLYYDRPPEHLAAD